MKYEITLNENFLSVTISLFKVYARGGKVNIFLFFRIFVQNYFEIYRFFSKLANVLDIPSIAFSVVQILGSTFQRLV